MNRDEAAAALDQVGATEKRLAVHAHWPFHRHAMFGLAEGLLIASVAQPIRIGAGMIVAALVLLVACIADDRRRHGIFVNGWRSGATRPLTLVLAAVVVALLLAAISVRDGDSAQPVGFLIGLVAFALCTAISLRWEKIYRAELLQRAAQ